MPSTSSFSAPASVLAPPPVRGRAWHGGWALGLGVLAALLLILARTAPPRGLLAGLFLAALPGAWGAFAPRPVLSVRLSLWTVGAVFGVTIAGGLGSPLSPLLAGPPLALLALGGASGGASALAALAFALAALLGLGLRLAAPDLADLGMADFGLGGGVGAGGGGAPWLRAGVLLGVTLAAAYALTEPRRRLVDVGAADTSPDLAPDPAGSHSAGPAPPRPGPDSPPDPTSDFAPALRAELAEAHAARAAAEARAEGRARFIAQMSHELRTPLNAILGFSDIMRSRLFGPLSDRYGEYAQLIHESGGHLLELINDVLDLSKIEADRYELRLERFDLREAVSDAMRLLRVQAEEAGVALRSLPPTQALEVQADRRAIKQIVLNLVSNALKFTPRGGAVDVILRVAAGAAEIVVSDTGVGIAPEDLARLGGAYQQAAAGRETRGAAQGTGLGLSLVKAFAALHGGDLSLESRLGEGVAATVRLPVLAPAS